MRKLEIGRIIPRSELNREAEIARQSYAEELKRRGVDSLSIEKNLNKVSDAERLKGLVEEIRQPNLPKNNNNFEDSAAQFKKITGQG